jgi:hypothetical protein
VGDSENPRRQPRHAPAIEPGQRAARSKKDFLRQLFDRMSGAERARKKGEYLMLGSRDEHAQRGWISASTALERRSVDVGLVPVERPARVHRIDGYNSDPGHFGCL